MFYKFIKNQENCDTLIGPFKINGKYIYDRKDICNSLVEQYNNQFSFSESYEKNQWQFFRDTKEGDLDNIDVKKEDILAALKKLDPSSTAGPDGVSSKLLSEIKEEIATPLFIILKKSLDEGNIPSIFKLAHITPIHKGGSKLKPEQYRPVSLTSHIMKVFERVVKSSILKHLVKKRTNKSRPAWICAR